MNKIYGIMGLLLFVCVFTALKNPAFLEPYNLQNNLRWIALFGILAIGVAFVIMTAGIDLSIGSIVGLTGCLLAMFLVEDIKRMDSHEVLSTSASNTSIHVSAGPGGFSPGQEYLFAGTIHQVEKVNPGGEVANAKGQVGPSALLSVTPAPKEGVASPAVRLHAIRSVDRRTNTFLIEGEHPTLQTDDIVQLTVDSDSNENVIAVFPINSVAIESGATRVVVEHDLRRAPPEVWTLIESTKHVMFYKRDTPMSVPVAIGLVLLISVGIGVFHGLSITKFGMQPFIVTLCGLLFYRGISREITVDQTQGFGTGYQGLKYLANGKPFSMAFLILMSGLLVVGWYWIKSRNAKRGGETNLKPYRIGMMVGLVLAVVGSSRYVFAWLPLGQQSIAGQHWVQENGIGTFNGNPTIKAIGDLSSVIKGDVVYFSVRDGSAFIPGTVTETWVKRDPVNPSAEPVTRLTFEKDPSAGQAVVFEDDAWPLITVGHRVTFVEADINEITITSDHTDLVRGDTLVVRSGAGTGQVMTVKSAKPTRDRQYTIVAVDAVPADVDLSSVLTVSMRQPRPQRIPGYLLVGLGGVALIWGLILLARPIAEKKWSAIRTPVMITVGGGSALLAGMTPIPLILVPMPFVIMLVCALAAGVFVNQTIYGRYILALGRNEQAARYSGINTDRMITLTYVLCALAAGVSGILFALDLNSIGPSIHGSFYELYAIAGAVLGGCSLRGGEGSILGAVIGVAVMRVLLNAINILGIDSRLEFAIIGAVIYLAVLVDELVRRWAARRRAAREARLAMMGD